jgi:hypothetical protein
MFSSPIEAAHILDHQALLSQQLTIQSAMLFPHKESRRHIGQLHVTDSRRSVITHKQQSGHCYITEALNRIINDSACI